MRKLVSTTIVICTLLQINCSTRKASIEKEKSYDHTGISLYCKELVEKIILPNWHFDESKQIYTGSKEFWEQAIFWNQYCFIGRGKSQIESILGKPTKEWTFKDGNTGVFYSLDNNNKTPPWHIQVNYDNNLKVISFSETMTFKDE